MTPNTRKPTVEEVGDDERVWVWSALDLTWYITEGSWCRLLLTNNADIPFSDSLTAWLPYHAIPDPNNTQQSQGEPT